MKESDYFHMRGAMKESLQIILVFALGVLVGHKSYIPTEIIAPMLSISVTIVLFCAGASIGINKTAMKNIRYSGLRALLLPFCTIVCVLLANSILWLFSSNRSFVESILIGGGFAYYSLSSAIVERLFSTELAALVLFTNIFIELWALLGTPLLIALFGPLAPIAVAGVSAMDICLPVIMRTSGKDFFIYATIHGMVLTILTPLYIYLIYFLSRWSF